MIFWGSRTLIFRGEKKSDAPSSCCHASIWEVWQRPPSPFQTSWIEKRPQFKGLWEDGKGAGKILLKGWKSSEFIVIIGSYYHDMLMLNHSCCLMISWKSTLCAFMYTYIYIYIRISINTILTICLVSLAVIVLVILMSTSTMTAGKERHTLMATIAMGPNRCRAITSFDSRSKGQIHPFQESTSRQKGLHPRKLIWIPKMMVWKRWFLLNKVIFGICQISGGY